MDSQRPQVHDFDLNLPAECEDNSCASVTADTEQIFNESWRHPYPTLTLISLSPESNGSESEQEASDTTSKLRSFFRGYEEWLSLSLRGQDSGEQIPLAPVVISQTSLRLKRFALGYENYPSLSLPCVPKNSQQARLAMTSPLNDQHSPDLIDRLDERAIVAVEPPLYADRIPHFSNSSLPSSSPTSEDRPKSKLEGKVKDKVKNKVKEKLIAPPYMWATDKRAMVHPLEVIIQQGIINIERFWKCKKCDESQSMAIDLQASFLQLDNFFMSNKESMHARAPTNWMAPPSLDCKNCGHKNCVKLDVVDRNIHKCNINWLYLGLTENLGFCTLHQLKYFSKHTEQKHRTGAKNRLLYQTYQELLKQLNPKGFLEGRYDLVWEEEEEEEVKALPDEI